MTAIFRSTAPKAMVTLIAEFGFSREDAAAILGNAGHESNGFATLQEIKPLVAGSRGGWGWFQWTGPRRRAFEAWAKAKKLDLSSYDANLGFLIVELRGTEKAAVAATKRAVGLQAKVEAFEKTFERAGIKHYPSRLKWAKLALEAHDEYVAKGGPKPPLAWNDASAITHNGVTLPKPVTDAPQGFWAKLAAAIAAFFTPKAP